MTKRIGQIRSSSDTPLWYLYEQGLHWEELRMAFWLNRGQSRLVADASARAAHYEAAWKALPETAHRSHLPRYFR